MLGFLNEQSSDLPEQAPNPSGSKKSSDNEDVKDKEFLTARAGGKKANNSTVLIVVLFAVGMLAIFFMIKKGTPKSAQAQAADAEQAQIDQLIGRLGGARSEMSSKLDTIVKKFYEFSHVKQVPLTKLSRNPFKMARIGTFISHDELKASSASHKSSDFQLFSIMYSQKDKKWCCMIDDKILYQGDPINGYTVTEISENSVKLEAGADKVTLTLRNDEW